MIRRPPRSTLTDTLVPYAALFRAWALPPGSAGARGREWSSRRPSPRCPRGGALRVACPSAPLRLLVGRVAVERPRRRELTELVADHVLGHQNRPKLLPVVDAERETHELRRSEERRVGKEGGSS